MLQFSSTCIRPVQKLGCVHKKHIWCVYTTNLDLYKRLVSNTNIGETLAGIGNDSSGMSLSAMEQLFLDGVFLSFADGQVVCPEERVKERLDHDNVTQRDRYGGGSLMV